MAGSCTGRKTSKNEAEGLRILRFNRVLGKNTTFFTLEYSPFCCHGHARKHTPENKAGSSQGVGLENYRNEEPCVSFIR